MLVSLQNLTKVIISLLMIHSFYLNVHLDNVNGLVTGHKIVFNIIKDIKDAYAKLGTRYWYENVMLVQISYQLFMIMEWIQSLILKLIKLHLQLIFIFR